MSTKTETKLKKKKSLVSSDHMQWTVLALPAILFFFIFSYIPMAGAIVAFKNYTYTKGIFGSDWVGLKNFEFFFTSQDAGRVLRNTVAYGVVNIVVGIAAAVVLALVMYEVRKKAAIKYYQTTYILPHFLSWVIVGYVTYILFNPTLGVFNKIIVACGGTEIDWYANPNYWPVILVLCNVWKHIGLDSIMYYASLMSVDKELYEAAKVDGASKLQQTIHISIPALVPIIIVLGIMKVGNIIRGDFGLFYQIPRDIGLLYPTTDIIDTYVYRGLRSGQLGISSAVGLFQSVVGLIMVLVTNAIVKKINPENAMF